MCKNILVIMLATIIVFLVVGCYAGDNSVPDGENDKAYKQTIPRQIKGEEWDVFEFEYDSFPDVIAFATEYCIYQYGVTTITAILTNLTNDPRYYLEFGLSFFLVRRFDFGWRRVPSAGEWQAVGLGLGANHSEPFVLKDYCFRLDIDPPNILYICGLLTVGEYRVVKDVLLARYESDPPRPFIFDDNRVVVWEGLVWAEFEVVE